MSILIKNIEMPKDGEMLCINIYPDGKVCINLDLDCKQIATAVPVPKHGRLIDADALFAKIPSGDIEHDERISRTGAIADVCTWVLSAPTVIEAEGEK